MTVGIQRPLHRQFARCRQTEHLAIACECCPHFLLDLHYFLRKRLRRDQGGLTLSVFSGDASESHLCPNVRTTRRVQLLFGLLVCSLGIGTPFKWIIKFTHWCEARFALQNHGIDPLAPLPTVRAILEETARRGLPCHSGLAVFIHFRLR